MAAADNHDTVSTSPSPQVATGTPVHAEFEIIENVAVIRMAIRRGTEKVEGYINRYLAEAEAAEWVKKELFSKCPFSLTAEEEETLGTDLLAKLDEDSQKRHVIPAEIMADARKTLESPDLLNTICRDLEEIGVVGEQDLALILYLVGTSRLLSKPLACIVLGHTASGKSYIASQVANLFPKQEVVRAHSLTPQALTYMPPGSLTNKLVVAGERSRRNDAQTADSTRMLREMLADGRVSRLSAGKLIEQEGPIAYIESTTLNPNEIFEEDLNRCLLVKADESAEQTRRIIDYHASRAEQPPDPATIAAVILKHWAMQVQLKQHPVIIPFAKALLKHLPDGRVENRRTCGHFLNVINAATLLFQHQRKKKALSSGEVAIVATTQDYELAKRCLARGMVTANTTLSPALRRFHAHVLNSLVGREFTAKDAAQHGPVQDEKTVREYLKELVDAGLVNVMKEGKGPKATKYSLPLDRPDELTICGLPSSDKLPVMLERIPRVEIIDLEIEIIDGDDASLPQ